MIINFARTVEQLSICYGEREALVNIERGRRYTHRELHQLTNRIVNMMRERLGLRRGDVYLCILDNDNLSLLHAWTALKGEATATWTNRRDSADEHRWQAGFVRPKVVFLEGELVEPYYDMLRELGATLVSMESVPVPREGLHSFWDLLEDVSDANPDIESDTERDILIYRFTGGTTGKGKCAQYTIANWLACRDSYYLEREQTFDADTRFLHMAPVSHGSGLGLLPTLFRGGCTVTQNAPDLAQWCRHLEEERITMAMLVPTLLYRLLDMPEATEHDLSSLRTVYYGAAPMSPAKLEPLQKRFGNVFVQVYGSTECLQPVATLNKADHAAPTAERLASAGRMACGVELLVVDGDGQPLPANTLGEIWVRSGATISGYVHNTEGTASEFANGFWKSGDLGYLDEEGYLYIVDRKKDMIITGGFNVYAIEVEAALDAHPAVALSAVVGVPHAEWGEAVHAEVVLKEGASIDADTLIEYVKARIGRFKAPKSIAFVDALPLSAVGKVLRRQIRNQYWRNETRQVG